MKQLIIIICLIIGILGIFGINKSVQTKNDTVDIQFSTWGSESELKILKPLIKDFEKSNPKIKISLLHIPQNYFQKLHLLFASNTAPDVVFINNQYLPIYANANCLEDLNTYKKDLETNKFYTKSLDALSYNNKLYAIPRDVSTLVIYYNKDIFSKYNIPYPKENWSYDKFLQTAKNLSKNSVFGISFEEDLLFYQPYLMSFGDYTIPEITNPQTKINIQRYADLRTKYHFAPTKSEVASATMGQLFLQQKLGMHLSGRWLVPKYREEANFDWDIAEFPQGTKGSIVPLDASGWAISKQSKHKKEALEFIKYISSKNSSIEFTKGGLITPARIEVANSNIFLDKQKKPKNAQIFLKAIDNARPTPVAIDYKEKVDLLKKQTEQIFNK